ncbi:DUF3813 domain-containing protein [Bacillus cereus]|uniref:DUF3813 domain-containing protein n=1 Tax=Bacillus cereus TaxID=1396 RepID=UPI00284B4B78|nr:DUF3813 domain-containing protein [Bacillus cereus]MDR4196834.1 DUF3813 domain-containing protein [Bacillus cereus]
MGNVLFQQARDAFENAVSFSSGTEQQDLVYRAKNALQSAYANSSTVEKVPLGDMQEQLQNITNLH